MTFLAGFNDPYQNKTSKALLLGKEIIAKGYKTVNMLGCHDGIVLDFKR
jgi:sucrose phosphorylase